VTAPAPWAIRGRPTDATVQRSTALELPEPGWPNREASRLVEADGLRWHLQVAGSGPALLLLHGTGSATHSWRGLLPLLAERFTVIAPDLPGHGHTGVDPQRRALTLPGMAAAVSALLQRLGASPDVAVGHSAGAAVALRMALDGGMKPRHVVGLNAALLPFGGVLAGAFRPLARLLAGTPALAAVVSAQARRQGKVERLIASTGSALPPQAIDDYRRVLGRPEHVAATLEMMAGWELEPLLADLPALDAVLTLVVGEGDRTISPRQAERIRRELPAARVVRLARLGHLAHEEAPAAVARVIFETAAPPPASTDPARAAML